jgi:hypothetical protein
MALKQRHILIRLITAILPAVVCLFLVVLLVQGWLVYLVTRPQRAEEKMNPQKFADLTGSSLPWSEERWANADNTQSSGWFLRGAQGAPAIILNHGYGRNRSELLDLGIRLHEAGYHALLPDLRGHGKSTVEWSSLGIYESDDTASAVKFLKEMKGSSGQSLIDQSRLGLYGLSIGGVAALTAAAKEPAVRTVIVDAVYDDPNVLTYSLMGDMFSRAGSQINKLLGLGMQAYLMGKYDRQMIGNAVRNLKTQKVYFVSSSDAGIFDHSTRNLFAETKSQKELLNFDHSRLARLEGTDQVTYDDRIVSYFRRDLPRETVPHNGTVATVTPSASTVDTVLAKTQTK